MLVDPTHGEKGFFHYFFKESAHKIFLCLKHLFAFTDYFKDFYGSAVSVCVDGDLDEEHMSPFIAPKPLNATFTIPEKKHDAIRKHRSRFCTL